MCTHDQMCTRVRSHIFAPIHGMRALSAVPVCTCAYEHACIHMHIQYAVQTQTCSRTHTHTHTHTHTVIHMQAKSWREGLEYWSHLWLCLGLGEENAFGYPQREVASSGPGGQVLTVILEGFNHGFLIEVGSGAWVTSPFLESQPNLSLPALQFCGQCTAWLATTRLHQRRPEALHPPDLISQRRKTLLGSSRFGVDKHTS